MRVFLIHVRDPQFYALPAKTRAKNGRIRVMGFPPIGIMSLSSVHAPTEMSRLCDAPGSLRASAPSFTRCTWNLKPPFYSPRI
ncbi:MAG: hypothetical protein E8D49_04330 [Nitrospira sp.]|nr:MAG: hypothetical protein E8D49_04330 [Nitrospira sp.]